LQIGGLTFFAAYVIVANSFYEGDLLTVLTPTIYNATNNNGKSASDCHGTQALVLIGFYTS